MRNLLFTATLLTSLFLASCSHKIDNARLLCYNVHNCVGLDKEFSCKRIANIINSAKVEAVALQELDSMTKRYPVDMLNELAEQTNMHATYGASIDFQGGKYGIGILTKERPISHRRVALPCRSEPRSLLIVELKDYYFCSTHLSLHEEDRNASVDIITAELAKLDKPAIIAGDFNAEPDSEPMQKMAKQFQVLHKTDGNGYTFPADKPSTEIDYFCIYSGGGASAEVTSHTVVDAPVESDHRPIFTEVTVTW